MGNVSSIFDCAVNPLHATNAEDGSDDEFNSDCILEQNTPLRDSILWSLLDNFYQQQKLGAWTNGIVPNYVTSNSYIARSYARMLISFMKDLASAPDSEKIDQPLYIVEVGSGHGKLGYLIVETLLRFSSFLPALSKNTPVPFKYIITDPHLETLEEIMDRQVLTDWISSGYIDFATFDYQTTTSLQLLVSGQEIVPDLAVGDPSVSDTQKIILKRPMFAICNYVFDSLKPDAFRVVPYSPFSLDSSKFDFRVEQTLVSARSSRPNDDITSPDILNRIRVGWSYSAIRLREEDTIYIDSEEPTDVGDTPSEVKPQRTLAPLLSKFEPYASSPFLVSMLESYLHSPALRKAYGGTILLPIGASETILRLLSISRGKLAILTGDKGYNFLSEMEPNVPVSRDGDPPSLESIVSEFRDPHLAFHGSFSMMTNFHFLRILTTALGGRYGSSANVDGFKTTLFTFSLDDSWFTENREISRKKLDACVKKVSVGSGLLDNSPLNGKVVVTTSSSIRDEVAKYVCHREVSSSQLLSGAPFQPRSVGSILNRVDLCWENESTEIDPEDGEISDTGEGVSLRIEKKKGKTFALAELESFWTREVIDLKPEYDTKGEDDLPGYLSDDFVPIGFDASLHDWYKTFEHSSSESGVQPSISNPKDDPYFQLHGEFHEVFTSAFDPDDFSCLQRGLHEDIQTPSLQLAQSLLRFACHDTEVFLKFKSTFIEKAGSLPNANQMNHIWESFLRDFRGDVDRVFASYYPLQTNKDICFELGRLLMGLKEFKTAIEYFYQSIHHCGPHNVTWHNIGLCHYFLNDYPSALSAFRRSLVLRNDYGESRIWLEKVALKAGVRFQDELVLLEKERTENINYTEKMTSHANKFRRRSGVGGGLADKSFLSPVANQSESVITSTTDYLRKHQSAMFNIMDPSTSSIALEIKYDTEDVEAGNEDGPSEKDKTFNRYDSGSTDTSETDSEHVNYDE